jgi:hypothetical protein
MFTEPEIDRLIHAMRANAVTALDVEDGEDALHLQLSAVVAPTSALPNSTPKSVEKTLVKSPCIGTFLPRGQDDGLDALSMPSVIPAGEALGYILHGAARACVLVSADGKLTGDIPKIGTVFGYGDVIFTMDVTS